MLLRENLCAPSRSGSGTTRGIPDFGADSRTEGHHSGLQVRLPHRQPRPAGGVKRTRTLPCRRPGDRHCTQRIFAGASGLDLCQTGKRLTRSGRREAQRFVGSRFAPISKHKFRCPSSSVIPERYYSELMILAQVSVETAWDLKPSATLCADPMRPSSFSLLQWTWAVTPVRSDWLAQVPR